uniref:Uncharacterized protein n=1 Tax=Glossina pallidipes TaxID=7398 RepID=A0A1A9ZFL2_GLOPL
MYSAIKESRHGLCLLSRNLTFETFYSTGLSTIKHRLYSHKRSNLVIETIKAALGYLVTAVNSGVYASQSDEGFPRNLLYQYPLAKGKDWEPGKYFWAQCKRNDKSEREMYSNHLAMNK